MQAAAGPPCPILTGSHLSAQEAASLDVGELRAYKLGKKRWSYNQVELVVAEAGGAGRLLGVRQAVHAGAPEEESGADPAVTYSLTLANGEKLTLRCYLVLEDARAVAADGSGADEGSAGAAAAARAYEWRLVDRCACAKGCSGPVLRAIQRFGKLGRRCAAAASPGPRSPSPDRAAAAAMKDPRFMYLSFDEATTHVGARSFRLLVAGYAAEGVGGAPPALLGAAVSPPVRVLANNDVPTGAAQLRLVLPLPASWAGWAAPAPAGRAGDCAPSPFSVVASPARAQRATSDDFSGLSSEGGGGGGAAAGAAPPGSAHRTRRALGRGPRVLDYAALEGADDDSDSEATGGGEAARRAARARACADAADAAGAADADGSGLIAREPTLANTDSLRRWMDTQSAARGDESPSKRYRRGAPAAAPPPHLLPRAPPPRASPFGDFDAEMPVILRGAAAASPRFGAPRAAAPGAPGAPPEDPIAAFVEMMLSQGFPASPVVKLPAGALGSPPAAAPGATATVTLLSRGGSAKGAALLSPPGLGSMSLSGGAGAGGAGAPGGGASGAGAPGGGAGAPGGGAGVPGGGAGGAQRSLLDEFFGEGDSEVDLDAAADMLLGQYGCDDGDGMFPLGPRPPSRDVHA
jgi:hypothetical protein